MTELKIAKVKEEIITTLSNISLDDLKKLSVEELVEFNNKIKERLKASRRVFDKATINELLLSVKERTLEKRTINCKGLEIDVYQASPNNNQEVLILVNYGNIDNNIIYVMSIETKEIVAEVSCETINALGIFCEVICSLVNVYPNSHIMIERNMHGYSLIDSLKGLGMESRLLFKVDSSNRKHYGVLYKRDLIDKYLSRYDLSNFVLKGTFPSGVIRDLERLYRTDTGSLLFEGGYGQDLKTYLLGIETIDELAEIKYDEDKYYSGSMLRGGK